MFSRTTILSVFALITLALTAHAETSDPVATASRLLPLAEQITVTEKGEINLEKTKWKREKESDGTELLTFNGKSTSSRAAVLRAKDGKVESVTGFKLGSNAQTEEASSFFFQKGKIEAYSMCEDRGAEKPAIGRVCVTATQKLCGALKSGKEVDAPMLKEADKYEMKALAVILALRGSDHQLDNMVKTGNRLGLKTILQTTKGQLLALARQIAKETSAMKVKASRTPAQIEAVQKIVSSEEDAKAKEENLIAKQVLERNLPRLKDACQIL